MPERTSNEELWQRSQSRRPSKEENGDGWVTLGGEQKATLPEQHRSGTPKDNAGEIGPITLSVATKVGHRIENGKADIMTKR